MKFRSKPVEIEAIQWDGTNFEEISVFVWGKVFPENSEQIWVNNNKFPLRLTIHNPNVDLDDYSYCPPEIEEGTWVIKIDNRINYLSDREINKNYTKIGK